MARKMKKEPEAPSTQPVVTAHSYVKICYPNAVRHNYGYGGGTYTEDFVKLLPREDAIEFARAIEQASKEVL